MLLQKIEQFFIDRADQTYQYAPSWAPCVESATLAIVACLTNGGRIFSTGGPICEKISLYWVDCLIHGLDRERPALPAWALETNSDSHAVNRQLMANSTEEDVLVLWSLLGQEPFLLRLVETAQEKGMTVIAITGNRGSLLLDALQDTDVAISLDLEKTSAIVNTQSLLALSLCMALDLQLMGDQS